MAVNGDFDRSSVEVPLSTFPSGPGCGSRDESLDGIPGPTLLNRQRQAALAEIDQADFSWFHVRVCVVSGVGFFTDAYDIFAISIAATMLGYAYGCNGQLSASQDLGLKVATPVGTLVGQLLFGWLADLVGRKRMYGVELSIIIAATFAQALAGSGLRAVNIIDALVVWRFIMGIGIGGDYPLSAVISSEFSSTRIRGRLMTAVFANQGWGQLTSSIVSLIIVQAYKRVLLNSASGPVSETEWVDYMWRLLIGFGCVPGAVALYFRLTIPETPRFTMDVERNVHQAARDVEDFLTLGTYYVDPDVAIERVSAPKASRSDFAAYLAKNRNWTLLLGTAYSWFALDVAFYGLGLNSANVLQDIRFGTMELPANLTALDGCVHVNATVLAPTFIHDNLRGVAVGNIILQVAGAIPGYWTTFFLIDRWGRKPIQLMGFTMLAVLFLIMGATYRTLITVPDTTDVATDGSSTKTTGRAKVFFFLYCLAQFFMNFGPNTTTFIVPGEVFPTRYRSTAHGISAACGKLGAIISQVGFAKLNDVGGEGRGFGYLLFLLAFFMATGIASTLLIKETKQRTLEELSNERQDSFVGGLALGRDRR